MAARPNSKPEGKAGQPLEPARMPAPNRDTERLFAYHEATKHSYWSVRTAPHFLDWSNQPDPFRIYHGAALQPLASEPGFPAPGTFATMRQLAEHHPAVIPSPIELDAGWLSRLLFHSMAISAWKQVQGTQIRYSLRVNPSSGDLHPTETHLAVRGAADLDDGLYHYRVRDHALERRARGDYGRAIAGALGEDPVATAPLVVVLTSIFWREAWKYRERAYRYCLLDLGHAAMSILLAARALGLPGFCLGHFPDRKLAGLLGVEHTDEEPLLVIPLGAGASRASRSAEAGFESPGGIPNELSGEVVPYHLLRGMHQSTLLSDEPGSCPSPPDPPLGSPTRAAVSLNARPPRDEPLGELVRRRRSALDFEPDKSRMTLDGLGALLAFATGDFPADFRGNLDGRPGTDLLTLYLYAHRISRLEPGLYRYHRASHSLELLLKGDQQRAATYLSLEQPLAGHAAVAFSLVADLEGAARAFGNRGYRYAHCEAGAIGQRLYLASEALGLQSTGIGAFYDDDVHHYLDLSPAQGQVIYHFAVGKAVPDVRLSVVDHP